MSSLFHLKAEIDPVSETLCFLVIGMPDNGQSPKPSNSLNVTHCRQGGGGCA
jgi:hypothetical protein